MNKVQWRTCAFSADDEYIVAASMDDSKHNLYIWNREEGPLLKTLEGPKEGVLDLVVSTFLRLPSLLR